jgi:hypothetical protein
MYNLIHVLKLNNLENLSSTSPLLLTMPKSHPTPKRSSGPIDSYLVHVTKEEQKACQERQAEEWLCRHRLLETKKHAVLRQGWAE